MKIFLVLMMLAICCNVLGNLELRHQRNGDKKRKISLLSGEESQGVDDASSVTASDVESDTTNDEVSIMMPHMDCPSGQRYVVNFDIPATSYCTGGLFTGCLRGKEMIDGRIMFDRLRTSNCESVIAFEGKFHSGFFKKGKFGFCNYNYFGCDGECERTYENGMIEVVTTEGPCGSTRIISHNLTNGIQLNFEFMHGNYEKSAYGSINYPNGDIYKGDFSISGGLRLGNSRGGFLDPLYFEMKYKNGDVYVGAWKNDKQNGHGKMTYNNGDVYEGEWLNDMKHGHGKMRYKNGDVYKGDWKNDMKHGIGKMMDNEGFLYIGGWKKDMKNGLGSMQHDGKNGKYSSYLQGEWNNDYPSNIKIFDPTNNE